jgi:hypothetical protein
MADQNKPSIVIHGFETTYKPVIDPDTKQPTGKMREIIWVRYSPVHLINISETKERVDFLDPANVRNVPDDAQGALKMDVMRHRWDQIQKALAAWQEGHEIPTEGVPLAAWSGLNPAQASAFKSLGLKTVEQIADMPEGFITRVQLPNVRQIKLQAQAFMQSFEGSQTANRIAALEEQNEGLADELRDARRELQEALDVVRRLAAKQEQGESEEEQPEPAAPATRQRRRPVEPAAAEV